MADQPSLMSGACAGRTALVTMATYGICREVVEGLARAGAATIILNGRTAETGAILVERLRETYPETRFGFIAADITDENQVAGLFERVERDFGGLDILVHASTGAPGSPPPEPFIEIDLKTIRPIVDGLYLSLIWACHHAARSMIKRGGGAIVVIKSDGAKVPTPGESVSGGAMAAAVMFTKVLAVELARYKIRANVVNPSFVTGTKSYEWTMTAPFGRALIEKATKRAKLGLPSAADVAPMVVFLASAQASHITGQVVTVNGGLNIS